MSLLTILVANMLLLSPVTSAQEEGTSPFSAGADLVSSYVWRGTRFGTGPAIQPYVEMSKGNFSVGSWGSYCFTTNEAAEADLYLSYAFGFGLSLGLTDYYFPGLDYFDFTDSTGAHSLEISAGYTSGGLSLDAGYIINEAGGAGSSGGDLYFEAGYAFASFGIVLGAGNGWYTADGKFSICNIGITTSREIRITDTFTLPLNGAVILNPDTGQFHVVVGISL
ncbi:MAG TPA: hypothetical protein ENO20_09305 [Bacteroides sp.]|nr:hypothetical protein [Bacteroides sp.]